MVKDNKVSLTLQSSIDLTILVYIFHCIELIFSCGFYILMLLINLFYFVYLTSNLMLLSMIQS